MKDIRAVFMLKMKRNRNFLKTIVPCSFCIKGRTPKKLQTVAPNSVTALIKLTTHYCIFSMYMLCCDWKLSRKPFKKCSTCPHLNICFVSFSIWNKNQTISNALHFYCFKSKTMEIMWFQLKGYRFQKHTILKVIICSFFSSNLRTEIVPL